MGVRAYPVGRGKPNGNNNQNSQSDSLHPDRREEVVGPLVPLLVLLVVAGGCMVIAWELNDSSTEEGVAEDRLSNWKLRLWLATRLYRIACWVAKVEDDL